MSEPFKLSWGDKINLQAFLALFNRIFGLRLRPAIAMLSVCQAQGRSFYRAKIRLDVRRPSVIACNFRTRQPRRSLSPKECQWRTEMRVASPFGEGMLVASSFFPAVFASAYYAGRNYSEVTAHGDENFLKAMKSIGSVMDQLPCFASVEDFVEAIRGTVLEDIQTSEITF